MADIYDTVAQGEAAAGAAPRVDLRDAAGALLRSADLTGRGLTVGSAPGNDIVLDDPGVSRFHLRVDYGGDTPLVTNLSTRHPATLAGRPLPAQTPSLWGWGQDLTIGPFSLRAESGGGDGLAESASAAPTIPLRAARLGLALDPAQESLRLTPDQPHPLHLQLRNDGEAAETVQIQVDGVPAEWVEPPAPLVVPAGAAVPVTLSVRPPRGPASRAGEYRVTVRARSQQGLSEAAATAYWTVLPLSDSRIELRPRRRSVRGGGEAVFTLLLRNTGNATTYYSVRVGEGEPALEYALEQSQVILEPGGEAQLRIGAQLRDRPSASRQSFNFAVQVQPAGGQEWSDTAQLQWSAGGLGWLLPVGLGALGLFLLGALLFRVLGGGTQAVASPGQVDSAATGTAIAAQVLADAEATAQVVAAENQALLDEARRAAFEEGLAQAQTAGVTDPAQVQASAEAAAQAAVAQALASQATQAAAQLGALQTTVAQQQAQQATLVAAVAGGGTSGGGTSGGGTSGGGTSGGGGTAQPTTAASQVPPTPTTVAATATPTPLPRLVFSVPPSNAIVGEEFANPVVVRVEYTNGTLIQTPAEVRIQIKSGTGAPDAILSGSITAPSTGGLATFDSLSISRVGQGYQLVASGTVFNTPLTVESPRFNVTPGTPTYITFLTQPGGGEIGKPFPKQPVVQILDEGFNLVTSYNGQVTASIATGTGTNGAKLDGESIKAVNGIATFTGLAIDKAGQGYKIVVSSGPLESQPSSAFNVNTGEATRLRFIDPPGGATAGVKPDRPITVEVLDNTGTRVTGFDGSVTLEFSGPGSLAPRTLAVQNGLAVFSEAPIILTKSGTYRMRALVRNSSLAPAEADYVVTAGSVDSLEFDNPPTKRAASQPFNITVRAIDSFGNPALNFSGQVTLSAKQDGKDPIVLRTVSANPESAAVFTGVVIDDLGRYTLTATSGNEKVETPLLITANRLEIVKPVDAAAKPILDGNTVTTLDVKVIATDASRTVDLNFDGDNTIVASLIKPNGCVIAANEFIVAPARPIFNNGEARFTIQVQRPCQNLELRVVSPEVNISSAQTNDSGEFDINPGPVTALAFVAPAGQPEVGDAQAGDNLALRVEGRDRFNNPSVDFRDAGGQPITNPSASFTLNSPANTSCTFVNPNLSGASVPFSQGVVTAPPLFVRSACNGYTLTVGVVGVPGIATDTSTPFNITADDATEIRFVIQPLASAAAGAAIPVSLEARDQFGNRATGYAGTAALDLIPPGSTITTAPAQPTFVAGLASFTFEVTKVGTYTLNGKGSVGATTLETNPDSDPFTITAAAPSKIVYSALNINGKAGDSLTATLAIRDEFDNLVTNANTLEGNAFALTATDPSCPANSLPNPNLQISSISFNGGIYIPTFSLRRACTYQLNASFTFKPAGSATTTTINSDPDAAVVIGAAQAVKATFTRDPGANPTGATLDDLWLRPNTAFPLSPQILVQDSFDNPVPGTPVYILLSTNPTSATLTGPNKSLDGTFATKDSNTAGLVDFTGLGVSAAGVGYTLGVSLTPPDPLNPAPAPIDISLSFDVDPLLGNDEQLQVFIIDTGTGRPIQTSYPPPLVKNTTLAIVGAKLPTFTVALFAINPPGNANPPGTLWDENFADPYAAAGSPDANAIAAARRITSFAGQYNLIGYHTVDPQRQQTPVVFRGQIGVDGSAVNYPQPFALQAPGALRGSAEFAGLCLEYPRNAGGQVTSTPPYGIRVEVKLPNAANYPGQYTLSSKLYRGAFTVTTECTRPTAAAPSRPPLAHPPYVRRRDELAGW